MRRPASDEVGADLLKFERALWAKGYRRVAGVDEVGRGPLAGPVVAAAVIFHPLSFILYPLSFDGVFDSKQRTVTERERAYASIISGTTAIGIYAVSARVIDRIGIAPAVMRAMAGAIRRLSPCPDYVLVDGTRVPDLRAVVTGGGEPPSARAVIHGDALSRSIAAASIVAKVTRDRLMTRLHRFHPGYGFDRHKGYGTPEHLAKLKEHGPTPHHRFSFSPLSHPELGLPDG